MSKLRWGILSTADIGMSKVTPAIQRAHNSEVVAIASRDLPRAEAAAMGLGIQSAYGTYDELLAADAVDAVYIPLPNDMHAEWTIKAARSGKHVLCEKPLAMNAAQASEMAEICAGAGVKLQEAFMYRHHPTWVEAKRIVDSGEIGELRAVQSWFSYFNDDPADIRNRMENGGGALMDIGCYSINLSRFLFGAEPERVDAMINRDPATGVDIVTSAMLEFGGGGQASFTCSTRAEADQRVHIYGSEGLVDVEIPFNIPSSTETRIFVTTGGGRPLQPNTRTVTFQPADAYTIQAEMFADAVLADGDVPIPVSDAVANMRVIDAILA